MGYLDWFSLLAQYGQSGVVVLREKLGKKLRAEWSTRPMWSTAQLRYRIYASMGEDAHAGWSWIPSDRMLRPRSVVRIRNPISRSSIYCEALIIDANFIARYNSDPDEWRTQITNVKVDVTSGNMIPDRNSDNPLVLSHWYRRGLGGLQTGNSYELNIKQVNRWWGALRAGLQHPQSAVRLSVALGVVGVALGLLSLALAVWGIWLAAHPPVTAPPDTQTGTATS